MEYLVGKRTRFDLAIDWSGMSPFQALTLKEISRIPYGQTLSYGQVAAQIGRSGAARAVGRANATNPVPLVIPCHRVVASDGSLRGYGAGEGLKTKRWLLEMERRGSGER
jgi:methylated-DNA-[protein]-cysteine S-methyltransferase